MGVFLENSLIWVQVEHKVDGSSGTARPSDEPQEGRNRSLIWVQVEHNVDGSSGTARPSDEPQEGRNRSWAVEQLSATFVRAKTNVKITDDKVRWMDTQVLTCSASESGSFEAQFQNGPWISPGISTGLPSAM
ncbi:hypothetical protein T265_06612 [Opisthorchis viverrini]|uniref:Uncharacterized protein n=1 Tax=Opisthorchis viverrini TaxID=6198 RepID=A0A074ZFH4_OPIVI|nr:hypothetical protein T265_06612 [Opisthorchis viverrini]KER26031.1 hypothetical protein T265_06612 [Opisthorchis viverrini]